MAKVALHRGVVSLFIRVAGEAGGLHFVYAVSFMAGDALGRGGVGGGLMEGGGWSCVAGGAFDWGALVMGLVAGGTVGV